MAANASPPLLLIGSGFRVLRNQVQGSGFGVQGSGFRVQGSGFRVQGSGFRVQGSGVRSCGFGVQGCRLRAHLTHKVLEGYAHVGSVLPDLVVQPAHIVDSQHPISVHVNYAEPKSLRLP